MHDRDNLYYFYQFLYHKRVLNAQLLGVLKHDNPDNGFMPSPDCDFMHLTIRNPIHSGHKGWNAEHYVLVAVHSALVSSNLSLLHSPCSRHAHFDIHRPCQPQEEAHTCRLQCKLLFAFCEFEIVTYVRPERKAFLLSIIDVVSNLRH